MAALFPPTAVTPVGTPGAVEFATTLILLLALAIVAFFGVKSTNVKVPLTLQLRRSTRTVFVVLHPVRS